MQEQPVEDAWLLEQDSAGNTNMSNVVRSEVIALPPRLQLAVAAWLDEYAEAPLTKTAYLAELQRFAAELQRSGLALDGEAGLIAIVARQIAARGNVRATTFNKRLSFLSSFYKYGMRHDLFDRNPIDKIKRRKVKRYARSRALDIGDVKRRLGTVNRGTLAGQRDYVLLSVALTTGRRRAELAGLRAGHIHPLSDGRVRITWVKVKASEDPMYDTLPLSLSRLLLGYLHEIYGQRLGDLPRHAAVWVSVSNNKRGKALSERALTDICKVRLGTTSVHRLRHTFAHQMRKNAAEIEEVQQRLGHKSVATTAIYLAQLESDENRLAEKLVEELGVGE